MERGITKIDWKNTMCRNDLHAFVFNILLVFTALYVVGLRVNVSWFSFVFDETLLAQVDVKPVRYSSLAANEL